MPSTGPESPPALHSGAAPNLVLEDAGFFHARGIFAYRSGDLNGAIADLDQALDRSFSSSYIDRDIVFYRPPKFDRAFADIAPARPIDRESRPKLLPPTAKKPGSDRTTIATSTTPLPQRPRAAAPYSWPERGFASATFQ
jgi:hypothetical protein